MAISEKRYAGEFIDQDGNAFKFDDLGCMVRYLQDKNNRRSVAGYFATDFESLHWVKAEEAYYVRSSEFRTPMSGGIVAFKDKPRAEAIVAEHHGQLLSFADVFER
jgi:copper chaperone NosL